jgi:hypothetical protein
MKALTVRQPWAALIASGRKTIELRTWRTHYRGPLVIVSAASRVAWGAVDLAPPGPRGCTVALVDLVDVRDAHPDDVAGALVVPRGGFAWVLANARPLQPVKVKGKLSLFQIDSDLVRLPSSSMTCPT